MSDFETQVGVGPEIAVDGAGNAFLSGATDLRTLLLAKYSPTGERLWTRTRPRTFVAFQQVLALDPAGHPVVAGSDYEYVKLCTDCGESESIYRLSVARYNADGTERWDADARLGRELTDYGYGLLQVDAEGSAYVGANYSTRSDDRATPVEFVLRKFGPGGEQLWSTNFAGTLSANFLVDGAGSLYVAVARSGTNELRKYVQPPRAPYLVTDLGSVTILRGHHALLHVEAGGNPAPRFQWWRDGARVEGATNNARSFPAVEAQDAGRYFVIVSNALGAVTSTVANLVVEGRAPGVTVKIASGSGSVRSGDSVQLCATVTGGPIPRVQWQRNGVALTGQTNLCLTLQGVQPQQAGSYQVVATNDLGTAFAEVEVEVKAAVLAVSESGISLLAGQCVAVCALHGLTPPVTFQWQFDGRDLATERNDCLSLCATGTNDSGAYGLIISNPTGSYPVPAVDVRVIDAPPQAAEVVLVPSGGTQVFVGETLALAARYLGTRGAIQWRFEGVDLPGATHATLEYVDARTNQSGAYAFVVTNPFGAVTSAVTQVEVKYQAPFSTTSAESRTYVEGSRVVLPAFARGGPPPEYRLLRDGRPADEEFTYDCCDDANGGFVLDDVQVSDSGVYTVIATNFLGAVTSLVATVTVVPAEPWDQWVQRNPLPQSHALLAVTHRDTGFVAVGDEGAMVSSPDGLRWNNLGRRGQKALRGVAFGGGMTVAVGNGGVVYTSSDGTNWVRRYTAFGTRFNDVLYARGRFLAVGGGISGSALTLESGDGVTWERRPIPEIGEWVSIAHGDGTYVAIETRAIWSSEDGTNWVRRSTPSPIPELGKVVFADHRFLVVGNSVLWSSIDGGRTWEDRATRTLPRLLGATYGNGRHVVVGVRGTVLSSSDTVTWRQEESGTPDRLETVDHAGGLFVAAGENGTVLTSPDGVSWTKRNQGVTRDLDGLGVSPDGILVVVGKGGTVLTSTDAVRFEERDVGTTSDLHGVAWSDGAWVAVGESGTIVTSPDAVRWTRQTSGVTTALKDVQRVDGVWFVVGTRSTLLTSPDGVAWTPRTVGKVGDVPFRLDLNGIASGNGVYLVVGDGVGGANGSMFRSYDGVRWDLLPFSYGKNLRGITFDRGQFEIVGNDGTIASSADAMAFTGGGGRGGGNLRDVAWTYDRWTVIGNDGYLATLDAAGVVAARLSHTSEHLHRAVAHRGKVVAIGNRGTILQSATVAGVLESPVRRPDGAVSVGIQGLRDRVYRLQAAVNPGEWTTLTVFTNRADRVEYIDPDAARISHRLYRLQEP